MLLSPGTCRAAAAASVLAFLVTCSGCSSKLSEQQAKTLADEILKHTPEVHFEPGTKFRWAVFLVQADNPYPDVTERVRAGLRERYILYPDLDRIPPEARLDPAEGRGYRGGFLFSVNIKRVAPNKVEVSYKDFEHTRAASEQTVIYEWASGAWIVLSKGPLLVS